LWASCGHNDQPLAVDTLRVRLFVPVPSFPPGGGIADDSTVHGAAECSVDVKPGGGKITDFDFKTDWEVWVTDERFAPFHSKSHW